jgi:hypothetical protein
LIELLVEAAAVVVGSQDTGVARHARRRPGRDALRKIGAHLTVRLAEHCGDACGKLFLNLEQGSGRQAAVVGVAPDDAPAFGVVELRREASMIAVRTQRTLDHIGDAEIAAERLRVGPAILAETRGRRVDAKMRKAHQVRYKLIGQA